MIIGTAGHIDHGKTTLVRALTGVDTDRLKEEKARGISIELGYAYTPLANGEVLGFIDVPGHERLLHTMVAGACGIDFALLVMAAGLTARVRSLHAQNRAADFGRAGERCALNLAGVDKSAISRGDWLADPRALAPSTRIDVLLTLLADSGAHLTSWAPLHVHLGTTHRLAHVVPLQSPGPGGESARVQLVFDTPMCALPGDRLIVRDAQGRHTLGGGRVLDPFAPARRRRSVERLGFLAALERMLAGEGITPLLRQARFGVPISELVRLTGCPPDRLPLPSAALTIAAGSEHWVLLPARWQALRASALSALQHFHADVPDA